MIVDENDQSRRHELAMMDKLVAILAPEHAQTQHGCSRNSYRMPYHNYSQQSYQFPTCSTNLSNVTLFQTNPKILTVPRKEILFCFSTDVRNALPTPTRNTFDYHSLTQRSATEPHFNGEKYDKLFVHSQLVSELTRRWN